LEEAEEQLAKVRDEKDMNAVYRKDIESIINERLSKMNYPRR
jgi:hypothetical protein